MLVCIQCQFKNFDSNKFCQKCGTSLSPKICEQCGSQVPLSAEYCPNCGNATKKKTGSIIGQLLDGRYQVVRALSQGAFGHTYLAQDTRIPGGRSCVIKHLQPESKNPKTLEKAKDLFHQEAEVLAKLGSHNQIPTLWDYFAPDQEFYLVQEFIDGHPLRDEMIPAQKWTESQVISLLQDVLGILVFVHNQGDKGVIHRDIKPENIMRRQQDNKLVLIDFGAIKKVGSQQSNPGGQMGSVIAGTRIGTFGYAPPEQNIGKPRLNSDIYALGMVAIEALTGIYPGNLQYDDNTQELLWQHLVSLSPRLTAILTQMVRSRWQDRYQSASEVLQALQQLGNSSHTPTVQATVLNTAQSTPVHELTLEWVEAGQARSQTIRNQQRSKNPGTVRIGRDPAQCDILLSDLSVSGLHVEIFFNSAQQRFYVRNLRETNPPLVDGRSLPTGEAVLNRGSSLRLGQIDLRVTAINLGQAGGVASNQSATATKPTEAATAHQSSGATPVAPTQNPATNNNKPDNYATSGRTNIKLDFKVLAIDLGTTKSLVAGISDGKPVVLANANVEGFRTISSVIAFAKNGDRLFGEAAKRQAVVNPENTFYSVKRFIGRKFDEVTHEATEVSYKVLRDNNGNVKLDCPVVAKQFAPEEILAQVLRKLVEEANQKLGEKFTQVVMTVPAYFNDSQRQAIRDAGKIAGLEVLRIINDTTAAALAYGVDKKNIETILIFNFGGGSFGVSILEVGDGVFEVLATSGDTHLGGDDFDKKIVDYIADEFEIEQDIDLRKDKQALQRLIEAAEKAKIELSSATQTAINLPYITVAEGGSKNLETTLTRARFEKLCSDLIDRCRVGVENVLRDAKLSNSDINEIVLVGGSTRIPAVQQMVENLLGKKPNQRVNRDEVVALGTAIQAGVLAGAVKDIFLLDVTPLSLGVETLGGVMTKIIPRNTTISAKKFETFSTAVDGQTNVEIHVLQGEREMASDNKSLGTFRLDGIPPAPRGEPQIEVTFDIDANGILNITAKDKGTGKEQSVSITGASTLGKSEVEQLLTVYQGIPSTNSPFQTQNPEKQQQESSYDTFIDVSLSAEDLQNGTQVKITLEDGQSINVSIPANRKHGQRVRVRGKGKLNSHTQERGNLYLRLIEVQGDSRSEGLKEFIQVGIGSGTTQKSLGVETLGGVMEILIPRNTAVPIKKSEIFSTAQDNQNNVEIQIFQGERELTKDNKSLGIFRLNGIPPAPKGVPQIEVIFEINPFGFLSVSAWDRTVGEPMSVTVVGEYMPNQQSTAEPQSQIWEFEQI